MTFLLLLALLEAPLTVPTMTPWPEVDRTSIVSTAKGFFPASHPQIANVTTEDNFAVVSFRNGEIEGRPYHGQLLLQRFRFGWQVTDLTTSRFKTQDILDHGISARDTRILLHGVISGTSRRNGDWGPADYGSQSDIDAVRAKMLSMQNQMIAPVKVYGGYAMLGWSGSGGGEAVFVKRRGQWEQLSGGGGCHRRSELVDYGMPLAIAKRFMQWFPCGPT